MDENIKNLLIAIFVILFFYALGIFAFMHVEGWSLLDAAYFLTATFTTIGYGDIVPETENGKLLAILFSWFGAGAGLYLIYTLATYRQRVLDDKVERLIDRMRKMNTTKKYYVRRKHRSSLIK